MVSKFAGLSVWEAQLLEHLTEHLATESDLISSYDQLGKEDQSDWVSYLMNLLAEEEARHHRFLNELVNALRAPIERDVGEMVPTVGNVANPSELLEAVERFLKAERKDARDLKHLSRGLRSMRGVSIWPLLIEIMQRDTEKHQAILRFVHKRLRAQIH